MTAYPDTSFLCALYRDQNNSTEADALFNELTEPLTVSSLLIFEFRQSVRWQTFLHRNDASKGYGASEAAQMLGAFQDDLSAGRLRAVPLDWAKVFSGAERISAQYTSQDGNRGFDILHVATALELGAEEFLTFDARQSELAKTLSLKVSP